MTEEQGSQSTAPSANITSDITERLKRKEPDMILAVVAAVIAILQFMIGASGGTILTAAMLLNLALIGWLGNVAWQRNKAGQGKGLLVMVCVAFILAAASTLYLCEGLGQIVTGVQTLQNVFSQ